MVSGLKHTDVIRSVELFRLPTHTKLMEPVNLDESVPPKVSSPLVISSELVGSNETETRFCVITPWANRLSVT